MWLLGPFAELAVWFPLMWLYRWKPHMMWQYFGGGLFIQIGLVCVFKNFGQFLTLLMMARFVSNSGAIHCTLHQLFWTKNLRGCVPSWMFSWPNFSKKQTFSKIFTFLESAWRASWKNGLVFSFWWTSYFVLFGLGLPKIQL